MNDEGGFSSIIRATPPFARRAAISGIGLAAASLDKASRRFSYRRAHAQR